MKKVAAVVEREEGGEGRNSSTKRIRGRETSSLFPSKIRVFAFHAVNSGERSQGS